MVPFMVTEFELPFTSSLVDVNEPIMPTSHFFLLTNALD